MSEDSEVKTSKEVTDLMLAQSITMASIATIINHQLGFKSNTELAESTEKIAFALVEALEETTDTNEKMIAEMKSTIQSTTRLIRLMDIQDEDAKNE